MKTITVEIRDTDGSILDSFATTDPDEAQAAINRVLKWYPDVKVTRTETEVRR